MTKNNITAMMMVLMTALVVFAGASQASAQNENLRKELEAVYDKVDQLSIALDMDGYENLLASDFTSKFKGKDETRKEYMNRHRETAKMVKKVISAETRIEDIEVDDEGKVTAQVSQDFRIVVVKDGKEIEVTGTTKSTECWEKTKDGWRMKSSEYEEN